nr:hypothetical protein [Gammaproteobacteria bacterium]
SNTTTAMANTICPPCWRLSSSWPTSPIRHWSWVDDQYRLLRQKLPSRKRLFHDIRALTCCLCFDGWDYLLDFMLQGFHRPIRAPDTG